MANASSGEKKALIMDAAVRVFEEKGLEKTSVRDIMKEAGFGLGTFYLYYDDKNDLKERMVLDMAMDIIYCAEERVTGEDLNDRFISFVDYIMDYLIAHPFELDLLSKNITWALYADIENDQRLSDADSTLKFMLNRYQNLFSANYSEAQQLYILAMTFEIVISTCRSALMDESNLTIDQMKPVLFAVIKKIFKN